MPVERPTFSESWYRVAQLTPRLRCTVQTFRQHFRGRMWHVIRDPASNQFYRVDEPTYFFIGLLDGKRTVAQAWEIASGRYGDSAMTQGEAIQALGQLYAANLLQAQLPGDAQALFERYKKRVGREVRGYLMNILFMRIPLLDPENILSRWVGVFGWLFTPVGMALWLVIVGIGAAAVAGRAHELVHAASGVLDPDNLIALYLCTAAIKAVHEFGHGFCCKWLGRKTHTGGEVHTMGILFLVFVPLPYVDASSAYAFRNKWHRAFVGAAGMYVELIVAAVAAVVWANTGPNSLLLGIKVHDIAYNVLFIASVSTVLFNANPLLRYDGYYILCDLIEVPNLGQRSKEYLYYLVKKYVYGVRRAQSPVQTPGERPWLAVYSVAAGIYRVFISFAILLFVADKFFFVGAVLAVAGVVTWVLVPLYKWAQYLATSEQLARCRPRAVLTTAAFFGAVVTLVGLIPLTEHDRAEGVVEPRQMTVIYAGGEGFVQRYTDSGSHVSPGPDAGPLVEAVNPDLEAELTAVEAQLRQTQVRWRLASTQDRAAAQAYARQIEALDSRASWLRQQLRELRVEPAFAGQWIAPGVEQYQGAFVERGQRLGLLASMDDLVVRVIADQRLGPRIGGEVGTGAKVDLRVRGRPGDRFTGVIQKVAEAGGQRLPSPALGEAAGGSIAVQLDDDSGTRTVESVFEVTVVPTDAPEQGVKLHPGQRVVVRFDLPPRPLAAQWWLALRQMIQRRFQV